MRKMHRTMRGKPIDMEALRERNGKVVAAGNVRMNARGDILGAGGKIVRTREEIAQEYHAQVRPEVERAGIADRLNAMPTPKSAIDPNFYRRPQPQSFDDVDFKTPEQIVAEAHALRAAAQNAEAEGEPQAPSRPGIKRTKLVQKDE